MACIYFSIFITPYFELNNNLKDKYAKHHQIKKQGHFSSNKTSRSFACLYLECLRWFGGPRYFRSIW